MGSLTHMSLDVLVLDNSIPLLLQRLPRKVIKRERQGSEAQDRDVVVIEERVRQVQQIAVVVVGGFNGFEGYAAEADDASGGDEA